MALNGRIDLKASYGAVANPNFDSQSEQGNGGCRYPTRQGAPGGKVAANARWRAADAMNPGVADFLRDHGQAVGMGAQAGPEIVQTGGADGQIRRGAGSLAMVFNDLRYALRAGVVIRMRKGDGVRQTVDPL